MHHHRLIAFVTKGMVMENPYRVVVADGKPIEIHDAVWIDDRVPDKKDADEQGRVLTLLGFQPWDAIVLHELWITPPKQEDSNE